MFGNNNQFMVSKLISLDGRFYDMHVSPTGDQLTLTSTEQLGQITNVPGDFRGMIYNDKGLIRLNGNKGQPMPVPEGEWKLLSYEIELKGYHKPQSPEDKKEKGEEAVMRGMVVLATSSRTAIAAPAATTGKIKPFAVRAGETLPMPFGPPFKAVVTAGRMNSDGKSVPLALAFIGLAGEQCNNLVVEGKRPPSPKFTITDPDGEVVHQGSFEYGREFTCRYSWRVPSELAKEYRVRVKWIAGPFEIKQDADSVIRPPAAAM
jgi:hypothetical protein